MKLKDLHYQKIYDATDERIYLALLALDKKEYRAANVNLHVDLETGRETLVPFPDNGD